MYYRLECKNMSSPPGSVEASSTRLRDVCFLLQDRDWKEPGPERMASEHIVRTPRWLRGRRNGAEQRCLFLAASGIGGAGCTFSPERGGWMLSNERILQRQAFRSSPPCARHSVELITARTRFAASRANLGPRKPCRVETFRLF